MVKHRRVLIVIILAWWFGVHPAEAMDRDLLFAKNLSESLRHITEKMRDSQTPQVPYAELPEPADYFVRVASRRHVLDERNQVTENARLGSRPYVFLTTPESLYGRSLLEIYEDIGYSAKDILARLQNQEMVAVVFRYPDGIAVSPITDGRLPDGWAELIFKPTWENMFALFVKLAGDAAVGREAAHDPYTRLAFATSAERFLVLGFPQSGLDRIKKTSYASLKAVKGADWEFRRLLEEKLSVFEHFKGNGRTHNEVLDDSAFVEVIGPNYVIKELPELAVVHLGRLTIDDSYGRRTDK